MIDTLSLSRPLDARQVRTRAALRGAILELAREMPFAEISIGDIAAGANVGPATFYRHYRDKNALLADVAGEFTNELALKITPLVAATDSRGAAVTLCEFLEEQREICTALLAGGAKTLIIDKIVEQAIKNTENSGISEKIWLPKSLGSLYMITSILTLVGWWLDRGHDVSREEMSILIDRLVLTPTLTPP